jgi:DNA modification methylase
MEELTTCEEPCERRKPPPVPLAVWPVAQHSPRAQRAGRYVAESGAHPAKMLPALAQQAIEAFTEPGDRILDPMCGIGTTIVEAAALDRRAIGVELEERWARIARMNLGLLPRDQAVRVQVRTGDARRLGEVVRDRAGLFDAVITSPPYGCDVGTPDHSAWGKGGGLCPTAKRNYSRDRKNLGHARGAAYLEAMAAIYAGCLEALHPGGFLVTVTRNTRRSGVLVDLAAATVRLAEAAGFNYLQHVIALNCAVRAGGLVAHPSFWPLIRARSEAGRGVPNHLVVHDDVLLFQKPEDPDAW